MFTVLCKLYLKNKKCFLLPDVRNAGTERVGAHLVVPPYVKTVNVVYDECMSSVATNVSLRAWGASFYWDTFEATLVKTFPWGFRAEVKRTDIVDSGWGQSKVKMAWIAHFSKFFLHFGGL